MSADGKSDQGGRYGIGLITCPRCSAPAGQPCRTSLAGLALAEDHRERVIRERDGLRAENERLREALAEAMELAELDDHAWTDEHRARLHLLVESRRGIDEGGAA